MVERMAHSREAGVIPTTHRRASPLRSGLPGGYLVDARASLWDDEEATIPTVQHHGARPSASAAGEVSNTPASGRTNLLPRVHVVSSGAVRAVLTCSLAAAIAAGPSRSASLEHMWKPVLGAQSVRCHDGWLLLSLMTSADVMIFSAGWLVDPGCWSDAVQFRLSSGS